MGPYYSGEMCAYIHVANIKTFAFLLPLIADCSRLIKKTSTTFRVNLPLVPKADRPLLESRAFPQMLKLFSMSRWWAFRVGSKS